MSRRANYVVKFNISDIELKYSQIQYYCNPVKVEILTILPDIIPLWAVASPEFRFGGRNIQQKNYSTNHQNITNYKFFNSFHVKCNSYLLLKHQFNLSMLTVASGSSRFTILN